MARFAHADRGVETRGADGRWQAAATGTGVRTGDVVRTGRDATARFDFPWMTVSLSPGTTLRLGPGPVLATLLEEGRVALDAQGDIVKLSTDEARVVGGGRAVVTREKGTTRVMALAGEFRVEAGGKRRTLAEGEGIVIAAGKPLPEPVRLPDAPKSLVPGDDVGYVKSGEPLPLAWDSPAARVHLEVLAVDGPLVLLDRVVAHPPYTLRLGWTGTFRWRVAALAASGLESRPSAEGLFCIVD